MLVGENQCQAVGFVLAAFLFPHELEGRNDRQVESETDAEWSEVHGAG